MLLIETARQSWRISDEHKLYGKEWEAVCVDKDIQKWSIDQLANLVVSLALKIQIQHQTILPCFIYK